MVDIQLANVSTRCFLLIQESQFMAVTAVKHDICTDAFPVSDFFFFDNCVLFIESNIKKEKKTREYFQCGE